MAAFEAIPSVLLQEISSFLPDHVSLCNLGLTCRSFRTVAEVHTLWESLHRYRWKMPSSFGTNKEAYKHRHLLERHVAGLIRQLPNKENREDLRQSFEEILALPSDAVECCWTIFQDKDEDAQVRMFSRALVRMFSCLSALDNVSRLSNETFECEGQRLEEYAIGVSRIYYDCEGPTDTTSQWIRERLDSIAETIRARFPSQGALSPDGKFAIMDQVFFQEMKFKGNTDDYFNYQNSLLHSALQRTTGIPMTLAIIYKCVGRRLCLHIDLIGVPGHVVAHVPALDHYVDVFGGGQRFTRSDLPRLAGLDRFSVGDVSFKPLSCDLAVHRILGNLDVAIEKDPRMGVTSRTASTPLNFAWNLFNNRGTGENVGSSWAPQTISDDFASDHLAGVDIASW